MTEHEKVNHLRAPLGQDGSGTEEGGGVAGHLAWMAKTYDKYFSTGFYEKRYPVANRQTFQAILAELKNLAPGPKHILDFGCGSGRYLLPVLKCMEGNFTAYDISEATLKLLAGRLEVEGGLDRVSILHGDLDKLAGYIEKRGKVDFIMLMFGVLSHVGNKAARMKVLRSLKSFLADGSSRIILSVPNKLRRFRNGPSVQRTGPEPEDITYSRRYKGDDMTFFYHLYTPESLLAELQEAGLKVYRICPESYFPESWVTCSSLVSMIDKTLCKFIPSQHGYGILAVAGLDDASKQ